MKDVVQTKVMKEPMFNEQVNESALVLIDSHIRRVKIALDIAKQEISIETLDALALSRKGEVLRALLSELNIMEQYRREIMGAGRE